MGALQRKGKLCIPEVEKQFYAFWAHGANPKRIKSIGAKGWRDKIGGDTWGPTILFLPVLPTGLKKHVPYATFREIAVQVFFCPFALVHLSLEKILVEGQIPRE